MASTVLAYLVTALNVFVPIFVAMDPIGALPLILAWTGGLAEGERQRQLRDAFLTAAVLGLLFLLGGQRLLAALGIHVSDFLVAGGLVLLTLAVSDLVAGGGHEARGSTRHADFGAVPIGTPLLVGPATLATLLILVERYGLPLTALAFFVNLVAAWALFWQAGRITAVFGRNGLRAGSKVASLLLAAIAVRLIREGIAAILGLGS